MASTIQFKRATAATLYALNPVLLRGEPGLEIDTNKIKYGDGVTPWRDLPYGNPAIAVVDGGEFVAQPVAPAPGEFSPPTLEGLTLWLDGTDSDYVHMVNNRLSVWEDMSETRTRFVQSNKANRPTTNNQIEAQDVVTFDGANDVLIGDLELPAEFTMLVAFRRRGASTNGKLITALTATNASEFVLCGTETGNEFGVKLGSTYYVTQPVDDLVPVVYTLQCTSTGFSTRLNGLNTQAETQAITGTRTHFALGGSRVDFSADNFSGDIAEVIIYDSVLAAADLLDAENYLMARWGIVQVQHPLLTGMQAFWPLNEESGNRVDITDAALELTPTGIVDFEAGVIGNAAKFTGGANYLTAPETLTLAGTFSVSLWFKPAAVTGSASQIIQNWAAGTAGQMVIGFGDEGGDTGAVWAYVRTTDDNYRVAAPDLEADRWYHIVLVFDTASNKLQLYVDGVQAAQTSTAGALATSNIPLRVGIGEQTATPNSATFLLDQLGIWSRALSSADVEMLYNDELGKEDFTADLYGDNVSLLLHMDKPANAVETIGGGGSSTLLNGLEAFWKFDDLEDMTGNGYTLENVGYATFTPGKLGNALTVSGGNYGYTLQYAKLSNFKLLRAAGFSVSGWVKSDNTNDITAPNVMSHGIPFGFCNGSLLICEPYQFTAGFNACGPGPSSTKISIEHPDGYSAGKDGNWHHVACTFDGSTAKHYVDNVLIGTQTGLAFDDAWPVPDVFFGSVLAEYPRTGQVDAVGYWTRALTAAEVAELYNNGNGIETFNGGGAPITPIPGIDPAPSLLLHFDGANNSTTFTDSSLNNLLVTSSGATISSAQGRFGDTSGYFDGTAHLSIPHSDLLSFGAGDFTIEAFVQVPTPPAAGDWNSIVSKMLANVMPTQANGAFELTLYGPDQMRVVLVADMFGNPGWFDYTFTLPNYGVNDGFWHHVALCRSGDTVFLFWDGIIAGQETYSHEMWPATDAALLIGGRFYNDFYTYDQLFNGYIDELRITKGLALYTGSFTPPTSAFPNPQPNPSLLVHFDDSIVDSSTYAHEITNNNVGLNAAYGVAGTVFNTAGLFDSYFQKYLSVPDAPEFDLSSGAFCVELRFAATGLGTDIDVDAQVLIAKDQYGVSYSWGISVTTTQIRVATANIAGDWDFLVSQAVAANTWHHLALTGDGTTMKLFFNGTLIGTKNRTLTDAPADVTIGCGSYNNPTGFFTGYIDEVRIVNGAQVYTDNFTPPAAAFENPKIILPLNDPNSNNVSLLLNMNGTNASTTFTDSSNNGLTVTANGATISTAQSKFGGASGYFGQHNWLSTPSADALNFGAGPFTVEMWVNTSSFTTSDAEGANSCYVGKAGDDGGPDAVGIWTFETTASTLFFYFGGAGNVVGVGGNHNMTTGQWYHVAVVRDAAGDTRLFLDGVQIGSTLNVPDDISNNYEVTIGGRLLTNRGGDGRIRSFDGYLDDLRITKGVARYTTNFYPPQQEFAVTQSGGGGGITANASLLLHFDGANNSTTFTDDSTNALTPTVTNAVISTTQNKFGGSSGYFNGAPSTLVYADSPLFGFGTGDFTIEMFINAPDTYARYSIISVGTYATGILWRLNPLNTDNLYLNATATNTSWNWMTGGTSGPGGTIPFDTWAHIALTRQNNVVRVFVDGVKVFEEDTGVIDLGATQPLTIGCGAHELTSTDAYFGYIDDLRVIKGAAVYTADFTPPTAPLSASIGGGGGGTLTNDLLAFWPLNETSGQRLDVSGNNRHLSDSAGEYLTIGPGGATGSVAGKIGYAAEFTGDAGAKVLRLGTPLPAYETPTGSVSAWVKLNSLSEGRVVAGDYYRTPLSLWFEPDIGVFIGLLSGGQISITHPATAGVWYHLVFTYDHGTKTGEFFVNGQSVGTQTYTEEYAPVIQSGGFAIGSTGDGYFNHFINGLVDAVGVWGRVLTSAEVSQLYNNGAGTETLTSGGGGGGVTQYITTFIDSSKHNHELTANGDARLDLEEIKYGNATGKFNAGHCSLAMSPEFAFGTGDFTVEFWGKLTYTASAGVFSIADSTQDAGTYLIGFRNDANMFGFCYDIDTFTFVSADISTHYDTWAHYAFVRLDGVLKMYINGVEVATANTTVDLDGGEQTTAVIGRRWVDEDDYYLVGHIDDFRITKGVARYISAFNPPTKAFPDPVLVAPTAPAGDQYAEYVTLLLHMDGANGSTSFIDNSYLQNTVTVSGAAAISTAQSKFGGASLDVTEDGKKLVVPAGEPSMLGAGDFTIECWLYWTGQISGFYSWGAIAATATAPNPGGWYFLVDTNTNNGVADALMWIDDSSGFLPGTAAVPANEWCHVAVVRSAGVIKMYLNGVYCGGGNSTTNITDNLPLAIGADNGEAGYILGHIDDFRITKGVARYTANFITPTAAFLNPFEPSAAASLLLHFDGANASTTFTDSGVNGLAVTANGNAQISTAQSKFGGSSGSFSSLGALTIPQTTALQIGTDDFTIEAWIYLNATQQNGIFGQPNGGIAFGLNSSGNLCADQANVGGSPLFGSSPVALNSWHHVAVSRAAGYGKLFLNGTTIAEGAWGADLSTTASTLIGDLDNGSWLFNGYIDELRVVKGTAVYTADFTPPTAPFGSGAVTPSDITGCDLWLDSTAGVTVVNGAIATWPDKSGNGRTATPADYAPAPTVATGEGPDGQDVVRFSGDPNVLDVSYQFNLKNSSGFVLLKTNPADCGVPRPERILSWQPATGLDWQEADGMVLHNNVNAGDPGVNSINIYNQMQYAALETPCPVPWTLVSWTIDENGNGILRIDGQEDTVQFYNLAATAGGNLYIGHGGTLGLTEALQGDIAEIALFDHKLGPAALVGLEEGVAARWFPTTPPTPPVETLLLARFDSSIPSSSGETFVDSSGNNVGLTSSNGAVITTTESKFGGASVILGVMGNGNVTINSAADLDLSSGDFTIEFWTLPGTQNSTYPSILGTNQWSVQNAFSIRYAHNFIANRFTVESFAVQSIDNSESYLASTTSYPPNQWYHVAITRQGLTDRLFVNGALVDSHTHTSAPNWPNLTADGAAYIGSSWDGSNGQYSGFVDDFHIVRGTALYTEDFPVPNLPLGADLKLLLHMDGAGGSSSFQDSSLNDVQIAANGLTLTTMQSRFGGASGYFSGSAAITGPDLGLGTDSFTLELWFKAENGGGPQYATLFANYPPDSTSGFGLYFNNNGYGSGGIGLYSWNPICSSTQAYDDGLWHHVAVTRVGDTCKLFVDGVLDGTGTVTDSRSFSSTTGFMIGGSPEISGRIFNGWIDEVRVVKGVAMYTSNFTPPTLPFPDPPTFSPVVLMHFDGANNGSPLVDSSPTGLSFSPSTSAIFDSMIKQFGDASFNYNNANDVYSTTRGVPDLSTGDFTLECWVYRASAGALFTTVVFLHSSADNLTYQGGLHLYITQSGALECNDGFTGALSGGNVPLNQWTHLAVVRTGGTTTLYIDGTSASSSGQSPVAGPYFLFLGTVPTMSGFESNLRIDELRIIKTAVYTGNFTPPTVPFND